jgi:hypothetical protein
MSKPLQLELMALSTWRAFSIWLLKATLIILAVNALFLAVLSISGNSLNSIIFSSFFSKITLFESGATFLIGGALAFSGSVLIGKAKEQLLKSEEKWSMEKLRKRENTANKYIAFAVILFFASLIISFEGF